jgi:monoamine oxidase
MAREADVIIVGAGLSGLVAAREVLDAGREPLVLEADERIGGRILTEEVDGVPLELGAQWIGDTHQRMEALAEEIGVKIYDQFEDGETTYEFAGEVLRGDAFHATYADELAGLERVLRPRDGGFEQRMQVSVGEDWFWVPRRHLGRRGVGLAARLARPEIQFGLLTRD